MNLTKIIYLTKIVHKLVKNPNLYVAAAVGSIPGALTGGVIGALSGIFIAPIVGFFRGFRDRLLGIDVDLLAGAVAGFGIGVVLGGIFTGGLVVLNIHKHKKQLTQISEENILEILLPAVGYSVELSIGMAIGAVIGSLKLLGFGTALGGMIGAILILILTPLTRRN